MTVTGHTDWPRRDDETNCKIKQFILLALEGSGIDIRLDGASVIPYARKLLDGSAAQADLDDQLRLWWERSDRLFQENRYSEDFYKSRLAICLLDRAAGDDVWDTYDFAVAMLERLGVSSLKEYAERVFRSHDGGVRLTGPE